MNDVMETRVQVPAELQEKALLGGDLAKLTPSERLSLYNSVCTSLGLNPLTRPFEYIQLNGKLTLYARKDCTEQLRSNRCISVKILSREVVEGVYVVTAQATEAIGGNAFQRSDESIGAVPIQNVQGDARANAMMKAETKAKRRVTLSICGLGMLDETEIETIPGARVVNEGAAPAARVEDGPERSSVDDPNSQPATQDNPPPPYVADAKFPFDPHKGKPISDESITEQELDDCLWAMNKYVKDPKKAAYKARNEELAIALEAELDRRRGQGTL